LARVVYRVSQDQKKIIKKKGGEGVKWAVLRNLPFVSEWQGNIIREGLRKRKKEKTGKLQG